MFAKMFTIYSFRQRSTTYIRTRCLCFCCPFTRENISHTPCFFVRCSESEELQILLWLDTTSCESRWQLATYILMKISYMNLYIIYVRMYTVCIYTFYIYNIHIHSLYEVWPWELGHSWCFPVWLAVWLDVFSRRTSEQVDILTRRSAVPMLCRLGK